MTSLQYGCKETPISGDILLPIAIIARKANCIDIVRMYLRPEKKCKKIDLGTCGDSVCMTERFGRYDPPVDTAPAPPAGHRLLASLCLPCHP
jgi:hypothetical protein